jgi:cation-transporting P-type ATPase 13A2
MGVQCCNKQGKFENFEKVQQEFPPQQNNSNHGLLMSEAMASCHAISWLKIEGKPDALIGDPLDTEMFKWTGWKLDEENATETIAQRFRHPQGNLELALLKRFDFESQLMRSSVVVMHEKSVRAFVKGAPEKIATLCSSVPSDFNEVNMGFTMGGYRVIAIATKEMPQLNEQSA